MLTEVVAETTEDAEAKLEETGIKQAKQRTMFNFVVPFALQETVEVIDPIVGATWTIARLDNKEYADWLSRNSSGVFDQALKKIQPVLHKVAFQKEIKRRNRKADAEESIEDSAMEAIEGVADRIDWDQIEEDSITCDRREGIAKYVVKDISPLDIVKLRCTKCDAIVDFSSDSDVCMEMSNNGPCENDEWEHVKVTVPYNSDLGYELLSDDSPVSAEVIKGKFPQRHLKDHDDNTIKDHDGNTVKFEYKDSTLGAVLTEFFVLETARNKSLFDKLIQEEALKNLKSA